MKSIMISIQPQWVEKILNGEKTIEIRKTMPKCELPVKVYIYCTNNKKHTVAPFRFVDGWKYREYNDNTSYANGCTANMGETINGKVVAEFTLKKTECWRPRGMVWGNDIKKTCLTMPQLIAYADTNNTPKEHCFAWHIENLKIYDKPKELSEFSGFIPNNKCEKHEKGFACEKCDAYDKEHDTCLACYYCSKPIKRPPQSYMYVEKVVERMTHKEILNLKFNRGDMPNTITLGDYLKKLFKTLWKDGEDFSSKRPLGNSDWQCEIYYVLIKNNVVEGTIDEYDCVYTVDYFQADKVILDLIDYLFREVEE